MLGYLVHDLPGLEMGVGSPTFKISSSMSPPLQDILTRCQKFTKRDEEGSLENSEINSEIFGSFICDVDSGHELCDKDTNPAGLTSGK